MTTIRSQSVTLAHLMPAPFVQQVGKALFEADMLSQFVTTLVDRPSAKYLKRLCNLASIFKFDLKKQLSRRALTEIPDSLVTDYPLQEIIRLLVAKFDKDQRLTDIIFHWENTGFDRWVAQYALSDCQAVYAYEYNCLATFEAAKRKNIACIYDIPSPEHDYVENLLCNEQKMYPELDTPYRKYCHARQQVRTQRRRQEWQLADVIITNSEFTKASYAAAGLDVSKVRVVPLGSPPVWTQGLFQKSEEKIVRFLWAGTFSIRKGAHYLLQAWKQLKAFSDKRLDVFGAMGLPAELLQNLPDSIYISGTVPHCELYQHYRRADVLVFPTLCDGFGMVVTEAFAQGLPVITTNRAGAADLVKHGVNGLIIPSGDANALAAALEWCLTHPKELAEMRQAAIETAASWQWSDYRQALIKNIHDGLLKAGY